MGRLTLIFMWLTLLSTTCSEEEDLCIRTMIQEFQMEQNERSFVGIYTFEQDGQLYHIFDSGVAFDATASVVDEACNTVCIYGGLRANTELPCDDFWDGINNRTQIWPE